MIREAMETDIPRIVELGSESLREGPYGKLLADKPEETEKLARNLMSMNTTKILVAEDESGVFGLFAMMVTPHFFSGEMVAGEIMWYVSPEKRRSGQSLELLWAAERLGAQLGAKKMMITAPSDEVAAIYGKLHGYQKMETAFQRSIEGRA